MTTRPTRPTRPAAPAFALALATLAIAPLPPAARGTLASAAHAATLAGPDHDHDHAAGGESYLTPATAAQAVRTLEAALDHARRALASPSPLEGHHAYDALESLGQQIGRLALAPASGVPRPAVREVNLAGKALAQAAHELHEAVDAGNLDAARAAFERLAPHAQRLIELIPHDYTLRIDAPGPLAPNAPARIELTLLTPDLQPVGPLRTVHERTLHLLLISADLAHFLHEHPAPVPGRPGVFELTFTPPAAGAYRVYADFAPEADAPQVARATLTIGTPGEQEPPISAPPALTEDLDAVRSLDGVNVLIRCNAGPFVAQTDALFRYALTDAATGRPADDLEPYLGAAGHLVILSADGRDFVHAHPLDADPDHHAPHDAHDPHDPHAHHHADPAALHARAAAFGNGQPSDVIFHAVLPRPGWYRAWAQFQRRGTLITVPFTFQALAPDPAAAHHDHDAPVPPATPAPSPRTEPAP